MISKLNLFMILFTITNVMSAKHPCLNFTDWISFKSNFTSKIYFYRINCVDCASYRPYKIQFNDIFHEIKA
jgi:hypothetical protein